MVKAIFLHQGMTVDIEINITFKSRIATVSLPDDSLITKHIVDYFESEEFKDVFLTTGKRHVPYPFLKGAIGVDLTKYLNQFSQHVFKKTSVTRLASLQQHQKPGTIEVDITYYANN
ncbi:hypothetical protein LCGC14_0696430 [marine sediment metagenome]|uniref:Uncharacterized protein n=1 Tax=marine sediment metagenome TaxID=412755 RepID=A0A0F9T529_9ZZZZ